MIVVQRGAAYAAPHYNGYMGKTLALLCNDLHISKDNIQEFLINWEEMLSVAKEYSANKIVIGGDIFTSMSSQTLSVLLAVKRCIQVATKAGFYLIVANGNHDKTDKESVEGYCSIYSGFENYEVVSDFRVLMPDGDSGVLLAVMSYFQEDGSFINRLEELKTAIQKGYGQTLDNTVLYIHEGIHGALGDFDIPGELPQDIFLPFHSVLCGHYHNRVSIGKNIHYIGSSRQHNFGEDEMKGYTILMTDGSTKFVQNQANTRYITHDVNIDEINDKLMDTIANYGHLYKVRMKVRCSDLQADNFDKKKLIDAGVSKVELVTEKMQHIQSASVDIDEKFDKEGILVEYQNFCNERDIDSELGIKYLNKIAQ